MSIQRRWFEEVWNQGREATIDELCDPNVRGHGLVDPQGNQVAGIESFRAFWRAFRSAFSDIHVDVQDTVTEGDLAVARYVVTGRHTGEGLGMSPKGNPVEFTGMTIVRIKDGKIVESWNNVDFATMTQQIG
jgi:predicted ester cyclase